MAGASLRLFSVPEDLLISFSSAFLVGRASLRGAALLLLSPVVLTSVEGAVVLRTGLAL